MREQNKSCFKSCNACAKGESGLDLHVLLCDECVSEEYEDHYMNEIVY